MKRRIVKKWIKRYLTTLVDDLPPINQRSIELYEPYGKDNLVLYLTVSRQHVIVNGKYKAEGGRSFPCDNMLLNIKRTADLIKQIRQRYKHIYLRTPPEIMRNRTYVRIITE